MLARGAARRTVSPAVAAKVARLGRGRDLKTRCTWPGGTLEFDLWVLTQAERNEAEAEAARALEARGLEVSSQSPLVLEAIMVEKTVHVLSAAMRDEAGDRLFVDAVELAEAATDDEIDKLTEMYARHRSRNDPGLGAMSEAELAEIEDCLKKKDLIRLSGIASSMPKASLHTLVAMLAISLTGRSLNTSTSPAPPSTEATDESTSQNASA
jgi:hypothetical protein